MGPGSSWGWKLPAGEEVMILIRQIIMLISQMCSLIYSIIFIFLSSVFNTASRKAEIICLEIAEIYPL